MAFYCILVNIYSKKIKFYSRLDQKYFYDDYFYEVFKVNDK